MVDKTLHSFLLSMPQAAGIWLIMLVVVLVAVLALSTPGRRSPTDELTDVDGEPGRRPRRRAQAAAVAAERDRTRRYAAEAATAADRATVTAHHARVAWESAHEALDEAWRTFDAAEQTALRAAQAVAFSISYPFRSPTYQEVFLRRVLRDRLFRAYREAQHLEQRAWHAAGVASAAMCSLREEAAAAALVAGTVGGSTEPTWWAEQWAPDPVRTSAPAPSMSEVLAPAVAPADADAIHPLRLSGARDDETTPGSPLPTQARVARITEPNPGHVRSTAVIRQAAVAGSAMVTS